MTHTYGAVRDRYDPRDVIHHERYSVPARLAPRIDYLGFRTAVRDQGQQGSCTGFATTAAAELARNLEVGCLILDQFSPAFTYWQARNKEGTLANIQAGAMPADAIGSAFSMGLCPESDDPYDPAWSAIPSAQALQDASQYRITSYARIVSIDSLLNAVSLGQGITAGIRVFAGLESDQAISTGFVPMPGPHDTDMGGHDLPIDGYDTTLTKYGITGYAFTKQSWGQVGDNGRFYVPLAYLASTQLTPDLWGFTVAAPVVPPPPPVPALDPAYMGAFQRFRALHPEIGEPLIGEHAIGNVIVTDAGYLLLYETPLTAGSPGVVIAVPGVTAVREDQL